ncbi:MAG: hypothetical protein JJE51_02095 [Thermoanaerobaculia bacterium]|nr:hypothetical protein [Thermoanaerobaculia bacterium]
MKRLAPASASLLLAIAAHAETLDLRAYLTARATHASGPASGRTLTAELRYSFR